MELFQEISRLLEEGRSFVLATVVEAQGSTPQKPGSKMVVLEDGTVRGTVGGGAIEKQIVDAALELLSKGEASRLIETHLTHDLGMCCGGKMRVFLERHAAADQLFVFGAGHVGREVALLADRAGFRVTVVDGRAEWVSPERFPGLSRLLLKDPVDFARALEGSATSYFCIVTHDHAMDQAVVEALLRKPSAYLGVIGSRRKAERFRTRLGAAGFTEQELSRMRSPMGLAIQALTPVEIAISIVGELVQVRRSGGQRPE